MSDTPRSCPTCGTSVPPGAPRCPGCGRVFGEENRCPHCHAIAAVIERRGTTVCAACGKPRVGTVTLGGDRPSVVAVTKGAAGKRAGTDAMLSRARGRTQRGFGVLSLATGIVTAALLAMIVPGAAGVALAVIAGLFGVGVGALTIRAGARNMERARGLDARAERAAVEELARARGGALTAAEVAGALTMKEADADALLTSLVGDGSRVDVEVSDEGVVSYVFHDLRPRPAQVRVESAEDEALEAAPAPARARRAKRADSEDT
ncbi:MAG: hypothetical protein KF729_08560 [Sandaracinaceae bacterium]|nr:hypothetical protein [Sandaracinaceae bacterium]